MKENGYMYPLYHRSPVTTTTLLMGYIPQNKMFLVLRNKILKKITYVYVQLNHFAVLQKLTHLINQLYFSKIKFLEGVRLGPMTPPLWQKTKN